MKKGYRAILIASAILVGTGLIATTAGLIMGARVQDMTVDGRSIGSWYNDPPLTKPVVDRPDRADRPDRSEKGEVSSAGSNEWRVQINESYTGITSLDLSAGMSEVTIREGDGFAIVTSGEGVEVQSYLENGEWNINSRTPKGWKKVNSTHTMTITVPKGWNADEIDIAVGIGVLEADVLSAREVSLDVGVGQIYVEHMVSGDTSLTCAMGQLEIGTAKLTGETDVECGMGQIDMTIDGKEEDYGYKYSVGMGSVSIGSSSATGIGGERSHNTQLANLIEADCGMGQITIEFTS